MRWSIGALLGASGCSQEPPPLGPISVVIVEPTAGSTVAAGDLQVRLAVHNLRLERGSARLDLKSLYPIPSAYASELPLGYARLQLDDNDVGDMHDYDYVIESVGSGMHVLQAVLFRQSGTPVDPPAADIVTFGAQ